VERDGSYYAPEDSEPLIVQTEKMSKSKLNGVSPDEIIEEFGADALRLYEMFMGPFDREKVWNTDAVNGCKRFLNRFFDLVNSDKINENASEAALKLGHRLLDTVIKDIEQLQFNTAIAHMMEFLNDFSPLPAYPRSVLKMAVQLLYPFAPHLAEELWEQLGEHRSLTHIPLPSVDPQYLVDTRATYIVQINGKLRGRYDLPIDRSQDDLMDFIRTQPEICKYLQGEIVKVVFVPNKLLNIVVK
jgi:leucyl-tRNA synthetase